MNQSGPPGAHANAHAHANELAPLVQQTIAKKDGGEGEDHKLYQCPMPKFNSWLFCFCFKLREGKETFQPHDYSAGPPERPACSSECSAD